VRRGPNPKTFMFMAIGTFILGLGASYMGYSQMTAAQGEIATLKGEVKDEKEVQSELDTAKAALDECSVKLQHLEQGIPELAYIPTLMTELEKTGKQFGIKVLGVRPMPKSQTAASAKQVEGGADKKQAYEELSIEIKGIGTYGSVMRWVNSLQQFPKIVAARSVQLSPKVDPGKAQHELDMTVELKAYVFRQPAAKAPKADLENKSASTGVKRNAG
jgi:Tfp pilus assembly protein PilO